MEAAQYPNYSASTKSLFSLLGNQPLPVAVDSCGCFCHDTILFSSLPPHSYVVNVFLVLTQFGFCAAYFVFMSDNLDQVRSVIHWFVWSEIRVWHISLCMWQSHAAHMPTDELQQFSGWLCIWIYASLCTCVLNIGQRCVKYCLWTDMSSAKPYIDWTPLNEHQAHCLVPSACPGNKAVQKQHAVS